MSPAIMVPRTRAENPTQGGGANFPEGSFIVTIDETRPGTLPPWAGQPTTTGKSNGYSSADGETLSLQLGEGEPVGETTTTPGNLKHFVEFTIRDGDHAVDNGPIPSESWAMERSAVLLTNLALALGLGEEIEDEEGNVFIATPENFLEELQAGAFNSRRVGVTTYHRPYTSKTGEAKVEVRTKEFFPAV